MSLFRPVVAGALLAGAGAPATAAEPPREYGLFGAEAELLPPPARPDGPTVLEPPARPSSVPWPALAGRDPAMPAASDAEIRRWIAASVDADPAVAADARSRLAGVPGRTLLHNAQGALREAAPEARLAAVGVLRGLGRPEAVRPLAARVLAEPDPAVRRAMAEALGALPDPRGEGEAWLRNRLLTGDRATRIRTAEVMGATGRRSYVEVLVTTYRKITGRSNRAHIFVGTQGRYIDDFNVEVTAGAFALDPHIGTVQSGCVLETMVIKIEEEWREIERRVVRDALAALAGVDLGPSPVAWEQWVRAERARKTGVEVKVFTLSAE